MKPSKSEPSIVKEGAQFGRRDRANIVVSTEYPMPYARDEIVRLITYWARNDGNCDSDKFPKAAKAAKDVNHAVGPNQEPIVAC